MSHPGLTQASNAHTSPPCNLLFQFILICVCIFSPIKLFPTLFLTSETHPCRVFQSRAGRHGSPPRCPGTWRTSDRLWCVRAPQRKFRANRPGTACLTWHCTPRSSPRHGHTWSKGRIDPPCHSETGRFPPCSHSGCPGWLCRRPAERRQSYSGRRVGTAPCPLMTRSFLGRQRAPSGERNRSP